MDAVLSERKEDEQGAAALGNKVNSNIQVLGSPMRKCNWKSDMALCGFVIPVMARGSRAGQREPWKLTGHPAIYLACRTKFKPKRKPDSDQRCGRH